MHVIWKRPDGFHGASPMDYKVVPVSNEVRIWLHKTDRENYPFRVSGGWQDEDATRQLNTLVNYLNQPKDEWLGYLRQLFFDSKSEDPGEFLRELERWLDHARANLKGDTWEMAIMGDIIAEVSRQIESLSYDFLSSIAPT